MSKGNRLRRQAAVAELSERKLTEGWAGGPRVRIRQAAPADLPVITELVPLAGVRLEEALAEAVRDGFSGAALRAGIRDGQSGFQHHMAAQFAGHSDLVRAYLHASLVLVADHRDQGIVGTLIAYPPANLIAEFLASGRTSLSEQGKQHLTMLGGVALVKIKAVAVTGDARGQGIGAALLKRCKQIYVHCGYILLYGQMPPTPGLDAFYRRSGFEIGQLGQPIDLWVIFGMHANTFPGPDERIFHRWQLPT
ncbi:UNVERIFIED_ORG: GNAT superfamily N-acetyltransferase [Microbispora rosea subsp. rosea]